MLNTKNMLGRFETYRVGVVLAGDLALQKERSPALERAVRAARAAEGETLLAEHCGARTVWAAADRKQRRVCVALD